VVSLSPSDSSPSHVYVQLMLRGANFYSIVPFHSMTAGWSIGLRLRNKRFRVQIPVVSRGFVMNNYTCSRVMAVYIYYYQYNLYLYGLCMFMRYLVSIKQVLIDTYFGLDSWCECGNLF
jgi:hypothetical protein